MDVVSPTIDTNIQVILCYLVFSRNPMLRTLSLGFADSQLTAYADPYDAPIFLGPTRTVINTSYIFHIINFFKCHLTGSLEFDVQDAFQGLTDEQLPRPWRKALGNELQPLGRQWMGSYGEVCPCRIDGCHG